MRKLAHPAKWEHTELVREMEVRGVTMNTVNLENIMLSERSHSKRTKYCRILFVLNVLSGQIYGQKVDKWLSRAGK